MTSATSTDETPRVWIGCLAHYNEGYLIGDWFDAVGADEVTLADVHRGSGRPYAGCEELWCLDHEHVPVDGEFGPLEAAAWGRVFAEAGSEQWPAVCAWVRSGCYVAEGTGGLPSVSDFEERYCGHWPSFSDYAEELADDIALHRDWPEEAVRYFNWSSWVADQKHDYVVCDAGSPDYGVYIFRSL